MKILCLGHLTYDTTLPVDFYPEENEKYHIGKKIACGGGPAPNAGYLLGKWNEDVTVAGVLGNDYEGNKILEEYENIGISTKYIEKVDNIETDTSYVIANTSSGSRTILTTNTNRKTHPYSLEITDNFDCLVFDGEEYETAIKVIENNPNAISILDAGNLREGSKALAPLVTYLVCSHDYAEEFTNMTMDYNDINSIIKIYEEMRKTYKNHLIITLESFGCFTEINGEYKIIPSIKVNPVDSAGAGDIFHGALTYFIIHNYPIEEALRLSNITGALSVKKIGSRYSISDLEEVINYREEK